MDIKKILKENKKSVTRERISVFDFISKKHIFNSNDLLNSFSDLWRASIFRILKLFVELWIVRRVDLWEKIETYEVNNEKDHHEHMKCEKCNSVISFHSDEICKKIFEKAKEMWFFIKSHNVWIFGVCKKCYN